MNISIRFVDENIKWIDEMPYAFGEIQINDHIEHLSIPLEHWSVENYEKQWREGFERIKNHDTSCLVSSALDPKKHKSSDIWALYKDESKVYVQPYILIFKYLPKELRNKEFTPETCYDFNTRQKQSSGDEWIIDIN